MKNIKAPKILLGELINKFRRHYPANKQLITGTGQLIIDIARLIIDNE